MFIGGGLLIAFFQFVPFLLMSLPIQDQYNGMLESFGSSKALSDDYQRLNNATLSRARIRDHFRSATCAICFFGLPRSFKWIVLPSIVQNILTPNKDYQCDIYVHYYAVHSEEGGQRSGEGGTIDPDEIFLLRDEIDKMYEDDIVIGKSPPILVSYTNDTDAEFWDKRGKLIKKFETTMGEDGRYLYYPWRANTYNYPVTLHNIVKQWHSIESVWNFMESTSKKLGKKYDRVAMLRNDVMYITPIDIFQSDKDTYDMDNKYAVIADFARYPVNDRMIYGPYAAIKIWASERFARVDNHVKTFPTPGYGMHSENFLNHSILTPIRVEQNIEIRSNPDICFFRARADLSVWISDCTTRGGATRGFRKKEKVPLVEQILGRTCIRSQLRPQIAQAHCPLNATVINGVTNQKA